MKALKHRRFVWLLWLSLIAFATALALPFAQDVWASGGQSPERQTVPPRTPTPMPVPPPTTTPRPTATREKDEPPTPAATTVTAASGQAAATATSAASTARTPNVTLPPAVLPVSGRSATFVEANGWLFIMLGSLGFCGLLILQRRRHS